MISAIYENSDNSSKYVTYFINYALVNQDLVKLLSVKLQLVCLLYATKDITPYFQNFEDLRKSADNAEVKKITKKSNKTN